MSRYCKDCGNTLCICKLLNSNVSTEEHHKSYEELYFESLKMVGKLGVQLKEANELLFDMIDDLYTPYRLGLESEPNPEWLTLKRAREYKAKYKEG